MSAEKLNCLPQFLPLKIYYSELAAGLQRVSHRDSSLAKRRLKTDIVVTPCKESKLSRIYKMKLYLKKEFLQVTGSFKERGARYALQSLHRETIGNGIILASQGSSGLGFCLHGANLKIPVAVVFPTMTPLSVIEECQRHNARVIVAGHTIEEAMEWAKYVAKIENLLYMNRNDHPDVIAANGSIGLEILEQVNNPDVIVVPFSNDTLLIGIAMVVKSLAPKTKIIGVKSKNKEIFDRYTKGWRDVIQVGDESFTSSMHLFDKIVEVTEEWISLAILKLMQEEQCIVSGTGAMGLAAIMSGQLDRFLGRKIVVVLSEGNIRTSMLARYLEQGLAAQGRLMAFNFTVNRNPENLDKTCDIFSEKNVIIKDMKRDHGWKDGDNDANKLKIVCQTRSWDESIELQQELKDNFKNVVFSNMPSVAKRRTNI